MDRQSSQQKAWERLQQWRVIEDIKAEKMSMNRAHPKENKRLYCIPRWIIQWNPQEARKGQAHRQHGRVLDEEKQKPWTDLEKVLHAGQGGMGRESLFVACAPSGVQEFSDNEVGLGLLLLRTNCL